MRFRRTLASRALFAAGIAGLLAYPMPAAAQEEPELPVGLEEPQQKPAEPKLPAGLEGLDQPDAQEPTLPEGLGEQPATQGTATTQAAQQHNLLDDLNLTGFWEIRGGVRTQHDPHQQQAALGETRLQLEMEHVLWEKLTFKLTTDLLYDAVMDRHTIDLERGRGFLDLREASLAFSPLEFLDVKVGRQILTWGTGDLLFLNDLFPKDWQSFFIGRDVEYLKAPSDAVKLSLFSDLVNWDIVYMPRFDPDRFLTGKRISYYNPLLGGRAGYNFEQYPDIPDTWFRDSEWATRIARNIRGLELAGYGYWGYWKSPGGMDFRLRSPHLAATFPRLSVYGGSARGPLAGGIVNGEVAYYDSREDREGNNRFINNSEIRFLVGYERQLPEIAPDLTVGGQYYVEWMMDYDAYRDTLLPIMPARDELRHVVTMRVTKLLMSQNLELSLFAYYSPSDSDTYLRPHISYKIDDHWKAELGGNVFFGSDVHTFFGQFSRNSNIYMGLRYSF